MDVHAEAKTGIHRSHVNYNRETNYPLEFNRTPLLGCSIGRKDCAGPGSLGLFLKINGKYYGLTCKHVVAPLNLSISRMHIFSNNVATKLTN